MFGGRYGQVYRFLKYILIFKSNGCRYVASFMGRVKQLKDVGIVPYIVFDGANLPAKAGTEKNRQLY